MGDRRRLFDFDIDCYDVYVSECDATQCLDINAPIASNFSYFLDNIGQTNEYWTNNGLNIEHCHCYWLYDLCLTQAPTTTYPTTSIPTLSPIENSSISTTQVAVSKNPTVSPSELSEEGSDGDEAGFVDDAIDLITDNYIYSGAAAVGLLCACCFLCILCINKRKQKKKKKKKKKFFVFTPLKKKKKKKKK